MLYHDLHHAKMSDDEKIMHVHTCVPVHDAGHLTTAKAEKWHIKNVIRTRQAWTTAGLLRHVNLTSGFQQINLNHVILP